MKAVRCNCPVCDKTIHKGSFYRHMRRCHGYSEEQCLQMKKERIQEHATTVICPICNVQAVDHEALAQHCSELHSQDGADGRPQDYTVFSKQFPNEQDYKLWLSEECKKNCISFWQRSKDYTKLGTKVRLRCNRAGRNPNTAKLRNRRSRKNNAYCSCFLNVEFRKNGMVIVKGCFGHAGHELDPALLHLSTEEQEYLKMLLEDHTISHIIQRVRHEYRERKSRLYFVSRDDLWNLTKKYKIRPPSRDAIDSPIPSPVTPPENSPLTISCREQGYQKLNEIMNTYATVEAEARFLVENDSDDILKKLDKILNYIKLAAAVIPVSASDELTPHLEPALDETKPHFQHSVLQQRGELKKSSTKTIKHELSMLSNPPLRDTPGSSWHDIMR
ncbi:hypothetical protein GCK32_001351 [Trichostrongylus colubriformis]|uniref:C2H2-type domain-containing protein n=1 Tax=Trichostrongylus colubriformis TaxID=6319 RepID=A0AAN8IRC5_TRICO